LTKLVASKKEKLQVTIKDISKIKKEVKIVEKEYEGFKQCKASLETEIRAESELIESVQQLILAYKK
jgi:predicted  nucleic acid-binding Zn-ribbon protein